MAGTAGVGGLGGEALQPLGRLRRREDYLACYRRGRRLAGTFLMLYSRPNDTSSPRLGITASRKVGGAVVRNRLRRRVREVYRRWPGRDRLPSLDLVVHLQPAAAGTDFAALRSELEHRLDRLAGRSTPPATAP